MHICGVISSLGAGGAERVLLSLMDAWVARGDTVTLLTLAPESTDHYQVPYGVRRISIEDQAQGWIAGGGAIGGNLSRLRALRSAIRRARPDIVLSFVDRMNVRTLLASQGLGIPVVVSERIDPRFHDIGTAWSILRKLIYPRTDALVVQTSAVRPWGESTVGEGRVHVVPNPLRPDTLIAPPPMANRSREIVAIGRLVPQKGFDLLLEAFVQLHSRFPDWRLRIVGDGPDRTTLLAQAHGRINPNAVIFDGRVQNPDALLREAQVFVLSSRYEGFPNVLLEALAAGCACLSTDCPSGPSDMIRHNEDGLLIPSGSVPALADALAMLLADDALRARLGAAAPDRAKAFEMPAIVAQWDAVFAGVERAA